MDNFLNLKVLFINIKFPKKKEADYLVNFKELKKIEGCFVKEKNVFPEKVKAIKNDKVKHLNEAKAELANFKSKLSLSEKELVNIFKALSSFNLQLEKLFKQNYEHKKQIVDLKRLRVRIPEQINSLKKSINSNIRIIKALKKDAKGISMRKTKYTYIVEELGKVVGRYEDLVKNMAADVKELTDKEKNLIEGKVIWAEKSALEDLGRLLKKFIMPAPKHKHKAQPKKKR